MAALWTWITAARRDRRAVLGIGILTATAIATSVIGVIVFTRLVTGIGAFVIVALVGIPLLATVAAVPWMIGRRLLQASGHLEPDRPILLDLPATVHLLRDRPAITDDAWSRIAQFSGPYDAYLHSDEWRQRRVFMLARAGYRCQLCNHDRRLQLHHRTYRRLGREHIGDLIVLCRECHQLFHDHRGMPDRH